MVVTLKDMFLIFGFKEGKLHESWAKIEEKSYKLD